jgi:Tol biopolymer transport system component
MNSKAARSRPAALAGLVLAAAAAVPVAAVELVSVAGTGAQGNFQSRYPVVSADGRYVAFESDATNLVPGDTNAATDIFVRDRVAGTTVRVSVTAAGAQVNAASRLPAISGDGQRIVFDSFGALLPDSGFNNCYLVDRAASTVVLLDRRVDTGAAATGTCQSPSISLDGNRVAFASPTAFLAPGDVDGNGLADVFVRTLSTSSTVRINRGPGGVEANAPADQLRISAFGSHVIYSSLADNLVPGDSNAGRDIFVSDLTGQTRRVSVGTGNVQANGIVVPDAALNADASLVAFSAKASSLPGWGVNVESVLYLRLPGNDLTVPVSLPAAGTHEGSAEHPDFSATGRWLVFWANDQLIPGVTVAGIYVVDLLEDTIALVSRQPGGQPAGAGNHFNPRISADGRSIVWFSNSALLVAGDNNGTWDVFHADNPLWDDTLFAWDFEL